MPFLIPLLSGVASFFGGAYVGKVVNDATASPVVSIGSAEVTSNNNNNDNKKIIMYGLCGLLAYFLYKKFLK